MPMAMVRPFVNPAFYGRNSPTQSCYASGSWNVVKRLRQGDNGVIDNAIRKGRTHICTYEMASGQQCNRFLRLSKIRRRNEWAWSISHATPHLAEHTTSSAAPRQPQARPHEPDDDATLRTENARLREQVRSLQDQLMATVQGSGRAAGFHSPCACGWRTDDSVEHLALGVPTACRARAPPDTSFS